MVHKCGFYVGCLGIVNANHEVFCLSVGKISLCAADINFKHISICINLLCFNYIFCLAVDIKFLLKYSSHLTLLDNRAFVL